MNDLDPCTENETPQAAFIDYGQIPGVGPSWSYVWNYGPMGYVTNYTYGAAGTIDYLLDNAIWSPVIEIDPAVSSHEIRFSVYCHMTLFNMAGQFYTWKVRSSLNGMAWSDWEDHELVYYGGPEYRREHFDVSDLVLPGAAYAQISLGVTTPWAGFIYGASTPAPYYDDVSWHSWDYRGPAFAYKAQELAQDNFPHDADGHPLPMDWGLLGAMDVPFDMGRDIIGHWGAGVRLGDSIVVDIKPIRAGAALDARPRMYYEVKTNPVFDTHPSWRSSGVPYTGWVEGDTIWTSPTVHLENRWSFTLPDRDFLYPGDVMHYYFTASDTVAGGAQQSGTLPRDLGGFGIFEGEPHFIHMQWPGDFTLHCLPTVRSATPGDVPDIMFWNDFGEHGDLARWMFTLRGLNMERGVDYDVYDTNDPDAGVGNGLGATGTATTLGLYEHLLYSCGDLDAFTMAGTKVPGVEVPFVGDGSDDIGLVKSYLLGGGNLFACGDDLYGSIHIEPDQTGASLVESYFGVTFITDNVRLSIDGQYRPTVRFVSNPTDLVLYDDFVADGGCPSFKQFDGMAESGLTAYRVAEFLDPDGESGAYPAFAAMVAGELPTGARIVTCPVDLRSWRRPYGEMGIPGKYNAPPSIGTEVLCDILTYLYGDCEEFNCDWITAAEDPDLPRPLRARHWPNPFNPRVKIEFAAARAGHVTLRVYDLRGELLRTLVDEERPVGPQVVEWDGRDEGGRSVASGVYFYEVRAGGEAVVEKMALVR